MRILIVDDSTLFRKVVRDALATCPGLEVVGVAADGKMALEKIQQYRPDVVTLDVEMPVLSGMEVLRELQSRSERPEVIMLSGMTDHSASITTQALRLGAFDFVLKPTSGASFDDSCRQLRGDLVPKIKALQERLGVKSKPQAEPELPAPAFIPPASGRVFDASQVTAVCIGVSTGGPAALSKMLPNLSANLRVPLLIVQHMPPVFTRSLAKRLEPLVQNNRLRSRTWPGIVPGTAYIAPGGHQMRVAQQGASRVIQITEDPPERSCRPSARLPVSFHGPRIRQACHGDGDDRNGR